MSKDFKYNKKISVHILEDLLESAGLKVEGVSYDSQSHDITIRMADNETEDPTPIVNGYTYTEPAAIDWEGLFAKAKTLDDKIKLLAKHSGLIPLSPDEKQTGKIR